MKNILGCILALSLWINIAQAMPKFEANVSVDITAKSVAEAKKIAVSQGVRKALDEVVLGISNNNSVKEINKLNDNQIQHFITGVQVLSEKTSNVRYLADLKVSVDEEILIAYLKENNLPIIVREDLVVGVVPVLEMEDENAIIWEKENYFRDDFMKYKNLQAGNVSLKVIDKNLGNLSMLTVDNVSMLSDDSYKDLIRFNGVDDLYIVKISKKDGKIFVSGKEGYNKDIVADSENSNELIERVISLLYEKDFGKIEKDDVEYELQNYEAVYEYSSIGDWIKLKKMLGENSQVQDIKILSMTNGKVHFLFVYGGKIEKLQGLLKSKGYAVRKEGDNLYVIK